MGERDIRRLYQIDESDRVGFRADGCVEYSYDGEETYRIDLSSGLVSYYIMGEKCGPEYFAF